MSMPIVNVGDCGQAFNAVVILGGEPAPAGELIRGSIPLRVSNPPNPQNEAAELVPATIPLFELSIHCAMYFTIQGVLPGCVNIVALK